MTSQVADMERFFNNEIFSNIEIGKETDKFENGDIVFKNVNYQYNKDKLVLNNINLRIKKNEKVAIIGKIGSGKSTLIKLLLKLNIPVSGNIYIGNRDINKVSKEEFFEHVFYIPQKPKLLNRTLYENIVYGVHSKNKYQNIKKITSIMNQMDLDTETKITFLNKMDENIGNEGSLLSGGQRQIVWILRALMRESAIIVMDEPTASLDRTNKQKLLSIVDKIGKSKTIIIISHDDVSFDYRKIYLNKGKIESDIF
jgi:ATP-binding cassette subfamily B protein